MFSAVVDARMKQSFYVRFGKRFFDLAVAAVGLILISPLLLAAGLAVKLSSRGTVFFRQNRMGQFGRPFRIFKFRTMRAGGEAGSRLTAAGDPRITPLGAVLRWTKIDELPQLINVVLGDMSFVGPRPEVPEFVNQYTENQRKVLEVRPGVTGPSANVHEEKLLSSRDDKEVFYVTEVMPKKLDIDLRYCEDITFRTDFATLLQTFAKLSTRLNKKHENIPQQPSRARFELRPTKK